MTRLRRAPGYNVNSLFCVAVSIGQLVNCRVGNLIIHTGAVCEPFRKTHQWPLQSRENSLQHRDTGEQSQTLQDEQEISSIDLPGPYR